MKILMTADPIGGVWSYALEVCATLDARTDAVLLATLGAEPSAAQRRELAGLRHVTVCESRYRLEWMSEPWSSLAEAAEWLLSLERDYAPDIVHLNHLVHGDLPWRAPVLVVGHSCVLSWWWAVHGERAPAEWQQYRARVRRSLRAARHVAAPTEAMRAELERWYGPFSGSSVACNARDPQRFHAAPKEPLVLAAGRMWDRGKNVATLCAAAAGIEWPVYVAGATCDPDGGQQVAPGVRLLGQLSGADLGEWYARAAIYALPARYEPFGLTALEAALSGCALVLGDIPSLREVWGDGAEYVRPDDPAALRNTVNALIAQPQRRRELVRRGAARARRYTPQSLAADYRRIYRSLLDLMPKERLACASYSSITR